jgi:hypothetical protein
VQACVDCGALCSLVLQGDQLYIQMELCGDSLAAMMRLKDRAPWREPELVGLLKQVCLAALLLALFLSSLPPGPCHPHPHSAPGATWNVLLYAVLHIHHTVVMVSTVRTVGYAVRALMTTYL